MTLGLASAMPCGRLPQPDGTMTDDDLWEAARERGRAPVREALRCSAPAEHTRVCPFCGQEGTTRREYCPHCGRSYFERPARLGPRARRILAAGALVALAVFAAWFVPTAVRFRHDSDAD